ncbi:hypothetical protein AA309_26965 [Microvirga vignae]|uniref:DUF6894 domain-containing protein n=1 Tax=Microvirga vignae TaxID=1225564 RepID=A0A0H1RCA3_9HYPH|nr:hypothetical protein [Microvirga vignae]KLK90252.1 hypothetical protein AA309_26965 [Microvirga vignae]
MATSGAALPRFYIDLRGHFGIREDLSGTELPDVAAAESEALRIAEELLNSWSGMLPSYYDEITIEVRGEDLRPIIMIPYSEFVKYVELVRSGKASNGNHLLF